MVLFTSERPLSRCENIKAIYDAYDGEKAFSQLGYRRSPEILSGKYSLMVTDEIPAESPGKVIFVPHGIEGTKTYGLDTAISYATPEQCRLITYAVCQSVKTKALMANQLWINQNQVLALGMPRTDAYFKTKPKRDKTLYFYAPTYRTKRDWTDTVIDWSKIDSMLHDDEILIVKPHMLSGRMLDREYKHIYEESNGEPSAALIIDCDVLSTDYSSIMLDGLCIDKPIVLFTKDTNYLETRGMYYSYPQAYSDYYATNEEEFVKALREAKWTEKAEERKEFFCGMCDGKSTERVIDLIRREE